MNKVETTQSLDHERYFFNKGKSRAFVLKKGAKLKGNTDNFIELSFEEYHDIISESEIENNFFSKMERDTTTEMVLETNSQKGYSYHELKNKAENFNSEGIPDFDFSDNLIKPFSEQIKKNNAEFLTNEEKDSTGLNENISSIVKKIQSEAKRMIPSKIAIKVENSKHISKMFNLSGKRKKKLNLTKKSISLLQSSLDHEKESISSQIISITNKISEYGENIINFAKVRNEIQNIIEQREEYIKLIPKGEKTPEQHVFIENFIKESEKIIVLLLDVNSFISSTEQRKRMLEFNRGAFEEVLNNVRRIDTILMPAMIGEYEAYVVNQNLSSSTGVKEAVYTAINEATNRNTEQMKINIQKAYSGYNDPVQNAETMLKRQTELLAVSLDIEDAIKESRIKNAKYFESISLINKSSVEMREMKGTSSIDSHLEYIEKLKDID